MRLYYIITHCTMLYYTILNKSSNRPYEPRRRVVDRLPLRALVWRAGVDPVGVVHDVTFWRFPRKPLGSLLKGSFQEDIDINVEKPGFQHMWSLRYLKYHLILTKPRRPVGLQGGCKSARPPSLPPLRVFWPCLVVVRVCCGV